MYNAVYQSKYQESNLYQDTENLFRFVLIYRDVAFGQYFEPFNSDFQNVFILAS